MVLTGNSHKYKSAHRMPKALQLHYGNIRLQKEAQHNSNNAI